MRYLSGLRRAIVSLLAGKQSTRYQEDPPSPNHHEDTQKEERRKQAETIELALREVAAANENDILASPLGRDHRKVTAGEEQRERHQRCGYTPSNADVQKYPQQGKHLR